MKRELLDINTRLAAALLVQRGELSASDVQALPFVESRADALEIEGRLLRTFHARRLSRRVEGRVGGRETYIQLEAPLR